MPAERPEGTGPAEVGDEAPFEADLPRWARSDLAWPLALACGFLGTWLGLSTGAADLAVPTALLLYVPLAWRLRSLGRGGLLPFLGGAFLIGVAAAVAGTSFEAGPGATAERLRFVELLAPASPEAPWATLARNVGLLAVLVLPGRLAGGLVSVGLAGLATAALASPAAAAAVGAPDPLQAFLLLLPPQLVLVVGGGAFAGGVLGAAAPGRAPRRELLVAGLALAALGLVAQGLWVRAAASWAP